MSLSPTGKRRIQNIALVSVGFLIAILLVEIGFRVSGWLVRGGPTGRTGEPVVRMGKIVQISKDRDLIYEYRPNVDTARYPKFTNSAGMRGPERALERPANTIRIAGIGDSVMAGELYPAEKTFMFVLEKMLNEAATSPTRFEALNFAVGGYNTVQESIAFRRKALRYDLDWAILGVVINDMEPPVFFRVRDPNGRERLVDRYRLESRLRFGTGLNPERLPWWAHSVAVRWVRTRFLWRHWLKVFRRAFGDIAQACRTRSIRLLVVVLTEDVKVGQKSDPREKWHRVVRETVGKEASKGGRLSLLETYPLILEHLEKNGLESYDHYWSGPEDPHPNVEGHRLIARMIFEKLKDLGILEEQPRP